MFQRITQVIRSSCIVNQLSDDHNFKGLDALMSLKKKSKINEDDKGSTAGHQITSSTLAGVPAIDVSELMRSRTKYG